MSVSLLEEVMSRRESLLLPQLPQLSLLTPSLTKFRAEETSALVFALLPLNTLRDTHWRLTGERPEVLATN